MAERSDAQRLPRGEACFGVTIIDSGNGICFKLVLRNIMNNWQQPKHITLNGQSVVLTPFDNNLDTDQLFSISHGGTEKESVWDYLYYGPFTSVTEMQEWYSCNIANKADIIPWVIRDKTSAEPIGFIAIMSIVAQHGRAEIGHVWLTPSSHKTKANTEAQYLLLCHLFDEEGYRRIEWRCNSLNHASRTAAARMGFTFEGRFRKHMYLKGASRDTDWFSMVDTDWPRCKMNFETHLNSPEYISLMRLNSE